MTKLMAAFPLAVRSAAACGVAALGACGSNPTDQGDGLPGSLHNMIVFASFREDIRGDIYAVRPDGSGLVKLTPGATLERYPAVSPDGTLIAFVSDTVDETVGRGCNPTGAQVMTLASGARTSLVSEGELCRPGRLHWSPDGLWVAVPGAGVIGGSFGTDVARADGSEHHIDFACASGGEVVDDWSPDSHEFVEESFCGFDGDLGLQSVEGSTFGPLASDSLFNECCAAWSPDGTTIAFVKSPNSLHPSDGTQGAIFTIRPDGQQMTHLVDRQPTRLAWSPDGSRIAFNEGAIYLMRADGSDLQRLSPDSLGVTDGPAWSPDGQQLAFGASQSGNLEIFVVNVDGSGLVDVSNDPSPDQEVDWGR